MGFTLILLMPLSILKINMMKAFLEKHCYIAGILATLSLASPFIKIVNTVYEEGMGGDNYTESYGRLSVADIIIEGTQALYKGVFDRLEVVILASLYIFAAVSLVQFFASVSKWHKTMFYTAIALFAAAFIMYLFIAIKVNYITIMYGYYVFLILQMLLILFSYKPKTYAKNTTR